MYSLAFPRKYRCLAFASVKGVYHVGGGIVCAACLELSDQPSWTLMPGWSAISWILTVKNHVLGTSYATKTNNESIKPYPHARLDHQILVWTCQNWEPDSGLHLSALPLFRGPKLKLQCPPLTLTWKIISLSKWLITLSKSHKSGYPIYSWVTPPATNHLLHGMILLETHPCQSWKPNSGVHLSELPLFRGPI